MNRCTLQHRWGLARQSRHTRPIPPLYPERGRDRSGRRLDIERSETLAADLRIGQFLRKGINQPVDLRGSNDLNAPGFVCRCIQLAGTRDRAKSSRVGAKVMNNDKLLRYGVIGTVVVAVCCFTPVLVVLVSAVGLSAAIGWLDYVLFPALGLFIGITLYALWKRRSA